MIDMLPDRLGQACLRVLTYHRVDDIVARDDLDPFLVSATPRQFEAQVGWLSRDFELVSLDDVLAMFRESRPLPKRAVLLTFDDAYADFAEHAWPVLRRHGAPAALFVPTAFPDESDQAFWWDRLYCAILKSECKDNIKTPFGSFVARTASERVSSFREIKRRLKLLPEDKLQQVVDNICQQRDAPRPRPAVLGWDGLRTLAKQGVTLAPHTHTHPLLDQIPLESVRQEVRRSADLLAEKIGCATPAFAYPSGHYNQQVAEIVSQEGFEIAFTTVRGVNSLETTDPLRIRRANVGLHTSDALIRLQLTALGGIFNRPITVAYPAR